MSHQQLMKMKEMQEHAQVAANIHKIKNTIKEITRRLVEQIIENTPSLKNRFDNFDFFERKVLKDKFLKEKTEIVAKACCDAFSRTLNDTVNPETHVGPVKAFSEESYEWTMKERGFIKEEFSEKYFIKDNLSEKEKIQTFSFSHSESKVCVLVGVNQTKQKVFDSRKWTGVIESPKESSIIFCSSEMERRNLGRLEHSIYQLGMIQFEEVFPEAEEVFPEVAEKVRVVEVVKKTKVKKQFFVVKTIIIFVSFFASFLLIVRISCEESDSILN